MSEAVVAERYAQALFELAEVEGNVSLLADKLEAFANTYAEHPELRAALENPVLDAARREAVLTEVARAVGVPPLGVRGLGVIARRRRLAIVPALASQLRKLSDRKTGVLRAQVTTAQKMPESYYQALITQLSTATAKKVVLTRAEDPSLIAGAITQIGDSIIDGSLRGRLEEAENQIVRALSAGTAS